MRSSSASPPYCVSVLSATGTTLIRLPRLSACCGRWCTGSRTPRRRTTTRTKTAPTRNHHDRLAMSDRRTTPCSTHHREKEIMIETDEDFTVAERFLRDIFARESGKWTGALLKVGGW